MGASGPGEIEYLSGIASPDVAVITNVGHAHLEGFGSLEGVARAKGEIVTGLAKGGTFVFNADDPWADLWRELAGKKATVEFGMHREADVFSLAEEGETGWDSNGLFNRFPVHTPDGEIEIELQLAGQHNRYNALAAVAAARLMGASNDQIQSGLAAVEPVSGRLQVVAAKGGVQLIDDSYNANPDSVAAAISLLSSAPGRRFLVLGELAEMGAGGDRFYRQLGTAARIAGIEFLYGFGPAGQAAEEFGQGGQQFKSRKKLLDSLKKDTKKGDRVLVKGSRRAGMEFVVEAMVTKGKN
jgi:UDP-N-acetylmuramoyl-tripeptide--D-alanyl-D-alanine ligase